MTDLHPMTSNEGRPKSILLIGVSRGLGEAMAMEFAQRHWNVVGTIRSQSSAKLSEAAGKRITVERLDITDPQQIQELYDHLVQRQSLHSFDALFVNAGVSRPNRFETIAEVSESEFMSVMHTNAYSAMRVVEAFQDLVRPDGLIGVMSSGQGSISDNVKGGFEVYRASKAALNQLMRSYAARHVDSARSLILMAPGWIQTDMGGPGATFTVEETVPQIVGTLIDQLDAKGLRYIDRAGRDVPW